MKLASGLSVEVARVPGRGLVLRVIEKLGAYSLRLTQPEAEALAEAIRVAVEETKPAKPHAVEGLMAVVRTATGPVKVIRLEPELPEDTRLTRPRIA